MLLSDYILIPNTPENRKAINNTLTTVPCTVKSLEKDSYNEIVSIAMEISEKIVQKNISDKVAAKYLDEYLGTKKRGSKK